MRITTGLIVMRNELFDILSRRGAEIAETQMLLFGIFFLKFEKFVLFCVVLN